MLRSLLSVPDHISASVMTNYFHSLDYDPKNVLVCNDCLDSQLAVRDRFNSLTSGGEHTAVLEVKFEVISE